MFGVIDIENFVIFLYSDLNSAISLFFKMNQNKDVSIQPNINCSLSLLSSQDNLYQVSLKSLHVSASMILNIAVIRNEECECSIGSILVNLSKEEVDTLSIHYKIEKTIYKKKKCALCQSNFKIWDHENSSYKGCVYNPCYYQVIQLSEFKSTDIGWGSQSKIDNEVKKLNVDKSKIFFIVMKGGPWGLYLSKNPLPENLKQDSDICWSCFNNIESDCIFIWGH